MIAAGWLRGLLTFALVAVLGSLAWGQQPGEAAPATDAGPGLRIAPESLPKPWLREAYDQGLQVVGGAAPWTWSVEKGELPPGLTLDPAGRISGTPSKTGEYAFTLLVEDSSDPPQQARREFRLKAQPSLELVWTAEPHLDGDVIAGSVKITNGGKDPADLTFIILAVNEYGKAFALGYQRFQLATDKSQDIAFSSNVPQGTYNVHADAVAETPSRNLIRRASLESAAPLEQR
jgi:putative Ig domain-containing protein